MTEEEGRKIYEEVERALVLIMNIRSMMRTGDAPAFVQSYGRQANRYLTDLSDVYWPYTEQYQRENSEE